MGDKRNAVSGHIQLFLTIILQNLQVRAAFPYVKYEWIMAPSSGLSRVKLVTFQCQIRRDINDYRFSRILSWTRFSFQGLFISVLYCFTNKEVMRSLKSKFTRIADRHSTVFYSRTTDISTLGTSISEVYIILFRLQLQGSFPFYLGQFCFIIQCKHSRLGIIDSTNGGRGFASRAKN